LVGAEISYSVQNVKDFEAELHNKGISHKQRMLYSINILQLLSLRFKEAKHPLNAGEIAEQIEIPISLCRSLLLQMQKCDLIEQTIDRHKKEICYVPALDLSHLNIGFIVNKLESLGAIKINLDSQKSYSTILELYNEMENAMMNSEANKNVLDL
jgi:membrane protein